MELVPHWVLFVCAAVLDVVGSILAIYLYKGKIGPQLTQIAREKDASLITLHNETPYKECPEKEENS